MGREVWNTNSFPAQSAAWNSSTLSWRRPRWAWPCFHLILTFRASSPAWMTGPKTVSVSLVSAKISGI